MKKNVKNVNSLYIVINIFLVVISYIFIHILSEIYVSDYPALIKIIGWINTINFLICEFLLYRKKGTLFDFDILFFLFFFLFCNGQIFLYSMGVDSHYLSVFTRSSFVEISSCAKYYCISQLFFSLGMLLIKNSFKDESYTISDPHLLKAIKTTGFILFFFSIIPFLYNIIPMVKNSVMYGYGYIYSNSQELDGVFGYLSTFFIPSLFILLFSEKQSKPKSFFILFVLLLISLLYLIIGTRSTALRIIISLIVFYNFFINKIKWKKAIKFIPIVIVILIIIPTVHQFRSESNKSISSFKEVINSTLSSTDNNFVVQSISELGFSSYSFILTERVIPSRINYQYGKSYLASIMMLIPSPLMGGYSFAQFASLDVWLQKVHNMSYGPGFSIIAETYYNFGWYFGSIFTVFISMLFSYMFNIHSSDKNKNTVFKLLSFVFFYSSLVRARFPFHGTVRNIFYMYFCIYILIYLIYNNRKKRGCD